MLPHCLSLKSNVHPINWSASACQTLYLLHIVGRVWLQSSTNVVADSRNVTGSTLCALLVECGLLNEPLGDD